MRTRTTPAESGNAVRRGLRFIVTAAVAVAAGCAGPARQQAVPLELQDRAVIGGFSLAIRTWGAALNPEFEQELFASAQREQAHRTSTGQACPLDGPPLATARSSRRSPASALAR